MAQAFQNIRLLLEYDGTAFVGWQRQTGLPSVQETIEQALFKITGESHLELDLTVAGRTDAGVHAMAQVANFKTTKDMQPRRFATALNHWLPNTIRVHRADGVPLDFHSRHWAQGKKYRYRVYLGPHPLAIGPKTAWHIRRALNLPAMREAAAYLLGEVDFESFRSAHCDAPHAMRCMYAIDVASHPRPPVGTFVDIQLHADAFCRHMCRIIAGSLVHVGLGLKKPAWIAQVLAQRERQAAGMTAPPWGLTLLHVAYDPVLGAAPGPRALRAAPAPTSASASASASASGHTKLQPRLQKER